MSSYAITGASKGIGLEFARQLAADPTNTVLAIVRNPNSPKISSLASTRPNLHIIKGDVTDHQSILDATSTASTITGGTLDVLIHNSNAADLASMSYNPTQVPFDPEATRAIFAPSLNTNVYGALWTTNAFLPLIEKSRIKKIVHISTAVADPGFIMQTGFSDAVAYNVAKAGMNVLVAKYAVELAPKGVKVLALSPGWVDTWDEGEKPAQLAEFQDTLLRRFQRTNPELKGPIQPEESVRKCLQVIERLDDQTSGSFLSHNGDQERWS